jgi:glutathione peroxidase
LSAYRGKVALVVNVASECGYTPQYAGLEALYEELSPKGLVILGFPSNEFGEQEPGTPEQIAAFAAKTYHVTFPLFEKVKTGGDGASPVYGVLSKIGGPPKWNFHKFVVSKTGQVVRAFPSKITPESKELRTAIEDALKDE